jgi:hypothetical protein
MKASRTNKNDTIAGCLSGCLVFIVLFPLCATFSFWLAFALGPMGCAFPNKCSQSQQNVKGIVSIVVALGGGVVLPIAISSFVGKAVRAGSKHLIEKTHRSDEESDRSHN